jgi:hypothetical protein
MKITVTYSAENAICIPDLKVDEWVDKLVETYENQTEDYSVVVGTEIMIYGIRVAIMEGRINHKDIVFSFEDEELVVDKDGRLPKWPVGFADRTEVYACKLLGW